MYHKHVYHPSRNIRLYCCIISKVLLQEHKKSIFKNPKQSKPSRKRYIYFNPKREASSKDPYIHDKQIKSSLQQTIHINLKNYKQTF